MNKYINIIIFSFFTLLLERYNLGFTFFIPVALYFGLKSIRNLILIFSISVVVFFFDFSNEMIPFIFLFVMIVIYHFTFQKAAKTTGNLIVCLICNILTDILIMGTSDIFLIVFYSIVSTFVFACLYFNQDNILSVSSRIKGFSYNEILIALIATVGGTTIEIYEINMGLAVAIYFSIYFASGEHFGKSILFNLLTTIGLKYYFKIEESFIIILVGSFYYLPKVLSTISLFSFTLFVYLSETTLMTDELVQAIMGIGLFFEIFRFSLINKVDTDLFVENLYENLINNINTEVVSFASFLDSVNKDLSYSRDYFKRVKEAISTLYKSGCESCVNRKDCLSRNKGKLYFYYKNLILNQKDEDFSCINYNEMKKLSYQIANKYNLFDTNEKDDILSILTTGFSTILRQISVETNIKTEIDYKKILNLKEALIDFGFTISYFNVSSVFVNNFLIEVGLYDINYDEFKEKIMKICDKSLEFQVSLVFKKLEKNKIYFNIIPKVKFEVSYGYGALAPLGNNVCGDNYIVKQLDNSKLIAAISDGMGKGIKANIQSSFTLKMIDEITNMNVMSETALQILNTLVYIQDYQEIYSTLDFVEINRQKGEGIFYKAGGTTTYLFHADGKYKKIENTNLPFGLEELIAVNKVDLIDGDLIIIASDGIFENVVDIGELEDFIRSSRHLEPQKLIYELLNYARYTDVITKDDMSVIALKIKEA